MLCTTTHWHPQRTEQGTIEFRGCSGCTYCDPEQVGPTIQRVYVDTETNYKEVVQKAFEQNERERELISEALAHVQNGE